MLVISQSEGEVLEIGPDVRIHIRRVRGRWVRLCIEAPREVEIRRVSRNDQGDEPSLPEPVGTAPEPTVVRRRRPAEL